MEADNGAQLSEVIGGHAERRSDRTRRGIMAAFSELVFASGFENVSIQGVAARAGIARSTFYEHFSGKEDLLCACLTKFFAIVADCTTSRDQPADLGKVLDHLWRNRRLTDAIFSGHARVVLCRNQADLIERRVRNSAATLKLPLRLAAIHLADAQISLIEAWLRGRAPCAVNSIASALFRSTRASAQSLLDD